MSSTTHHLADQGFIVRENVVYACNGVGLQNLLQAGHRWLTAHVEEVNRLNVFPVPDGDTGINMVLTLQAVLTALADTAQHHHSVGVMATQAAHGALMGARGNSGVILSQFLAGLATALETDETFTTATLAPALKCAARQAYHSVAEPVEGTLLTVARAAAQAARQQADSHNLVAQLAAIVTAAQEAQAATPELLPLLKEAGVTDSGGQGLVYIFEGWLRLLRNQSLTVEQVEHSRRQPLAAASLPPPVAEADGYGYDVQFLINGAQLDPAQIRAHINTLGWSTVVVGSNSVVKVHLHTTDPGAPLSYAVGLGTLQQVEIEDLSGQVANFRAVQNDAPPVEVGFVAVAPGPGLAAIFESLGNVTGVVGHASHSVLAPTVETLRQAIEQQPAKNVLLLPNNGNIILAAQQACRQSSRPAQVVNTKTAPQGVAALLAYNPDVDLQANLARMEAAMGRVKTIELTRTTQAGRLNGTPIAPGQVIARLDGRLSHAGAGWLQVIRCALLELTPDSCELMTIYYGQAAAMAEVQQLTQQLGADYPALEIEVYAGGQPHYQYIISVE